MNLKNTIKFLFGISMFINVIAVGAQPITIFSSQTAEGVSIVTFALFFCMQVISSIHGKINLKDRAMTIGFGISALLSLTTIILCFIYK